MKRGLGTAMILSASLAVASCNSPKPAMVNKTPAAETIMADAGVKEKKPESRLNAVFSKAEEKPTQETKEPAKPAVSPVPGKPPVKKTETGKTYKWEPLPILETKRSDYDPAKDTDPWYPVDKDGVRLDKKEKPK